MKKPSLPPNPNDKPPATDCERLTLWRADGGRFQIAKEPLSLMRSYIQNTLVKYEAGGVLLGRHINETSDIVVDLVTEPMPSDRCSRLNFFRARTTHQETIDLVWQQSKGTCIYLKHGHKSENIKERLNGAVFQPFLVIVIHD